MAMRLPSKNLRKLSKDHNTTLEKPLGIDNEVLLHLEKIVNGGACISHNDGNVYFVNHGLPGETVKAKITSVNKHFRRAEVVEIIDRNPHRVAPPCQFAGAFGCGGCDFQHVELSYQRKMKEEVVKQCLNFIGDLDVEFKVKPPFADDNGLRWRNRIRLIADKNGSLGMRRRHSHDVIPITDCLISRANLECLPPVKKNWPSGSEIELIFTEGNEITNVAYRLLTKTQKQRSGKNKVGISRKDQALPIDGAYGSYNVFNGERRPSFFQVGNYHYRVSPASFFQVHKDGARALLEIVLQEVAPEEGDEIADLYCGVGLFTVPLAGIIGKTGTITGVENNYQAAEDAKYNLRELPQAKIRHSGVTKELITTLNPRTVLLDPPRSGAGVEIISAICQGNHRPEKIVYVSCDPATLARDVKALISFDYKLSNLIGLDIFPMTSHVETIATFIKK